MNEFIQTIITALIFFGLGFFSGSDIKRDEVKTKLSTVRRKIKNKSGVLPFKQPEEFEPESVADKKLEDHWRASGIAKLIGAEEKK